MCVQKRTESHKSYFLTISIYKNLNLSWPTQYLTDNLHYQLQGDMLQLNMKAAINLLTPVSGSLLLRENIAYGDATAHTTQPMYFGQLFLTEL